MTQVIYLFKKLLLLSAFNQFLLPNSAKFYPEREPLIKDNFNSITYISHGVHFVTADSTNDIIKIIFTHKLELDEPLENLSINTNIQFSYLNPRPNGPNGPNECRKGRYDEESSNRRPGNAELPLILRVYHIRAVHDQKVSTCTVSIPFQK